MYVMNKKKQTKKVKIVFGRNSSNEYFMLCNYDYDNDDYYC